MAAGTLVNLLLEMLIVRIEGASIFSGKPLSWLKERSSEVSPIDHLSTSGNFSSLL